ADVLAGDPVKGAPEGVPEVEGPGRDRVGVGGRIGVAVDLALARIGGDRDGPGADREDVADVGQDVVRAEAEGPLADGVGADVLAGDPVKGAPEGVPEVE